MNSTLKCEIFYLVISLYIYIYFSNIIHVFSNLHYDIYAIDLSNFNCWFSGEYGEYSEYVSPVNSFFVPKFFSHL